MFRIACFCLVIGVAIPVWSQVQPSAYGGGYDLQSEHMMTPPPVSREGYPGSTEAEQKENFLALGAAVSAAYVDNLMVLGTTPLSDETYTILPMISFDRRTPRHGETLRYSPGFRLYQNTTQLNSITQDGSASFRYHFTPYAVLVVNDSVSQNANLYNQANPFVGGGISGATGTPTTALIEPYADQLSNSTGAGLEYQYAKDSMIGVGGSYSFLQYSGQSFLPTLSNQDTAGGNAFFNRRFGRSYAGVTYQLSKYVTHPFGSYTVSNTVLGFFTHYFTRTVSFSVLGGPERYTTWSEVRPKTSAWTPAVQASVGWQVARANLAANYAHIVSGAGGLIGTYHSDTAGLSAQFMLSRKWSIGLQTSYLRYDNINSSDQFGTFPGGNTITGGFDVERQLTEHLSMQAGYQHLHQDYAGVTVSNSQQDSNRASVSIVYGFSRPLGR